MTIFGRVCGLALWLFALAAVAIPVRSAHACTATQTSPPVWRTTLEYPDDSYFVTSAYVIEEPRWVKFTILLCDPGTVYFHNGNTHRFHYDFARARLSPFVGMTREQFDSTTLHAAGQQAVLGAVLIPGFSPFGESSPVRELAIQLVRQDAYTREQVRDWFNLVRSRITGITPGTPVLYFPTFEQQASALTHRDWLAAQGIEVSNAARWITRSACYAPGWAFGTLKYVPGGEIAAAYRAGTLRPHDVLLTDSIPAEAPPVAGIATLSPATPNSHVALLSQTWGIPFIYLAGEDGAAAQALIGSRVIIRSYVTINGICNATMIDASALDESVVAELAAMKSIPPLDYDPLQTRGSYFSGVDALTPADTRRVGGKAAQYGLLRRAIPNSARPAATLGFDLWTEYLNQPMIGGLTLRQIINARLAGLDTWPPSNPAGLAAALSEVRNMFTSTSTTRFTAAQEAAILAALQNPVYGFDPDVKIRFRSSTNVEDTATFTGAGLYDSFSGCLRDDIDPDTVGPSACDPAENNERGVFRAIRRVFASFYNDNAYQARRRLGVNETEVGMAMLVHHSFPDETEIANGVAVLEWRSGATREVRIVSQPGATSVTNPEDGSTPEDVGVYVSGGNYYPDLMRSASRLVLGQTTMTWPGDYNTLSSLLVTVATRYANENPGISTFALDFEFKKTTVSSGPANLEIKQVRPLPRPSTAPSITPMLVNSPQRWCLFQGETSNVLSNHRLKAEMVLGTDSKRLTPGNLATSFMGQSSLLLNGQCRVATVSGEPDQWPMAAWTFAPPPNTTAPVATQHWRFSGAEVPAINNPRRYALEIEGVPPLVSPAQSPVVSLGDFGFGNRHIIRLYATHDQPVPIVNWLGQIEMTTTDDAAFCPCPKPTGIPVHRRLSDGVVSIDSKFQWVPGGAAAGYTFDMASWERTIITGLIPRPIELRSWWSQTYRPGHHNFTEDFVFDPRLEPGISPAILHELSQAGIAYVLVLDAGSLAMQIVRMTDACLPCPADWDASGGIGVGDIFMFLAAWFSQDPRADWDGSGALGVQDLFEFLAAYFSGCP